MTQFLCITVHSPYSSSIPIVPMTCMSESKTHRFRPPLYNSEPAQTGPDASKGEGREQQGWEAYRKWLSSVNGKPRSRRAPIDHSIYSWKGYNTWAESVRESWKSEDS